MSRTLDSASRAQTIEQLQTDRFDLIVIGGGITGAGIALDAASRGLSVALVEMRDFASGTSSKSTKLIHGGLRYLKQFEIKLVRETGRERAIVHKLAPHLVVAEKMLLPLLKDGTYGKIGTSFGLMVYDFLADVEEEDKRKMLSREQTLEKEPLLRREGLTGSGYYAEYRTDDSRLTIENIKKAAEYGTVSMNYLKAVGFLEENGRINGITVEDMLDGGTFDIRGQYTVAAAGPWVDDLRKVNRSFEGENKRLFLSKGVHIVVPRERLPVNQSVYFDVPDGRMMFAIPRNRVTYIGTTDTPYKGDLEKIPIYLEDVNYILEGANAMFPTANLTVEDVESSWAGLRPLIYEEGKSASEMSRKDEIFEAKNGLIAIAGGKLTGYRKMADRIVDLVGKRVKTEGQASIGNDKTSRIPLTPDPFTSVKEVDTYRGLVAARIRALNLPPAYINYLVHNYGKQVDSILDTAEGMEGSPEENIARAELKHCLDHELTFTALDFYNRRTGRLYFFIDSIDPTLEVVLGDMAAFHQWPAERVEKERQSIRAEIERLSRFEPMPADAQV